MSAASQSMARRPDGLARDFGSGPIANDNDAGPDASSALPPGAQAVIEPVPRATNQGGRGGRGQWRGRFTPRWRPVADPLETIELRFSDLEAAADYCRRQGLNFSIHGAPGRQLPLHGHLPPEPARVPCCWPTGPHAPCRSRYPAALESALGAKSPISVAGMAF